MKKLSRVLLTVAFVIGCLSLWVLLGVFNGILRVRFYPWADQPLFTQFVLRERGWLLCIPLLPAIFSVVSLFRREQTNEGNMLYASVLAVVFVVVLFLSAIAVVLPWNPHT